MHVSLQDVSIFSVFYVGLIWTGTDFAPANSCHVIFLHAVYCHSKTFRSFPNVLLSELWRKLFICLMFLQINSLGTIWIYWYLQPITASVESSSLCQRYLFNKRAIPCVVTDVVIFIINFGPTNLVTMQNYSFGKHKKGILIVLFAALKYQIWEDGFIGKLTIGNLVPRSAIVFLSFGHKSIQ